MVACSFIYVTNVCTAKRQVLVLLSNHPQPSTQGGWVFNIHLRYTLAPHISRIRLGMMEMPIAILTSWTMKSPLMILYQDAGLESRLPASVNNVAVQHIFLAQQHKLSCAAARI